MDSQYQADQFLGAWATPTHIGRQETLGEVMEFLAGPGSDSRIAFVVAEGGMGKTRFLREVLSQLGSRNDLRCASDLIDAYHIQHHVPNGLAATIVLSLSPPEGPFRIYNNEVRELDRMRLGGRATDIGEQQEKVLRAFGTALHELAIKQRVVLVLDTAERLIYGSLESDNQNYEVADSWKWLETILVQTRNLSLLVAGRSEIDKLISRSELTEIHHKGFELHAFTESESIEYLNTVIELVRSKSGEPADVILQLTSQQKADLWRHSAGLPIFLSLSLDLLSFSGELPFSDSDNEVSKEFGYTRNEFERRFITRLMEEGSLVSDTIVRLGRLPKGADDSLLSTIVVNCGKDEAQARLDAVKPLSFVKIRPSDQRVFLHDVIYDMLQNQIYDSHEDVDEASEVFEGIYRYYESEYEKIRLEIDEIFWPIEHGDKEHIEILRLGDLNMRRRTLMVEMLFYRLRHKPVRGFLRYSRYMREAIMSGDTLLDRELTLTLQDFWREKDPTNIRQDIDGLNRDHVIGENRLRSVARSFAEGRYRTTIENARRLREELVGIDPNRARLTRSDLNIYEAYAMVVLGENSIEIENLLEHAKESINSYLQGVPQISFEPTRSDEDLLIRWRAEEKLAFAARVAGYHYRVQGRLTKALENYKLATRLWKRLNVDVELGQTLNDLSFVLREIDKRNDAIDVANEGLSVRRRLGSRSGVGLSQNTLGLIYLADGNYAGAERHCTQALALFRAIGYKRGIGLALIALAETVRRRSDVDEYLTLEEKVGRLRTARDLADEAVSIFTETKEALRLIEAYTEVGCALRNWVRLRCLRPNPKDPIERLKRSAQEQLENAAKVAQEHNFPGWQLDAYANLAWLGYFAGDNDLIAKSFDQAESLIPPDYRINTKTGEPKIDVNAASPDIWQRISKLYTLRGHLDFAKHIQSSLPKWQRELTEGLSEAAKNYTLCLEYDRFVSTDSPAIRRVTTDIHEKLTLLTPRELNHFQISVLDTEKLYSLDKSQLREILERRGIWVLDTTA